MNNFEKCIRSIKEKWLKDTSLTLLLIAIIVAIYFEVNVLVDKLNVPDIDLTKSQIYSLSNETKDKIKGIDKEIDILLINMQNYDYVTEYADKYVAENQNIKIERIDNLASRTDIMSKYNMESSDSGIVVKCGEKEKELQ